VVWLAFVAAAPATMFVLDVVPGWGNDPEVLIAVTASTALLTLVFLAVVLRADTVASGGVRSLLMGAALGALNVGLSAFFLGFFSGDLTGALLLFLMGTIFGTALGAPAGLVLGVTALPLLVAWMRSRQRCSLMRGEMLLITHGGWLAAMAMLQGVAVELSGSEGLPWFALAVVASAAVTVGGLRIALRVRWLRRVAEGQVEGFNIADAEAEADALPALVPSRWAAARVLIRLPSAAGPYRAEQPRRLGAC